VSLSISRLVAAQSRTLVDLSESAHYVKQSSREDLVSRVTAVLITLVILLGFTRLLLHRPQPSALSLPSSRSESVQIYFIERQRPALPPPPPPQPSSPPPAVARTGAPSVSQRPESAVAPPPLASKPAQRDAPQVQLYTRDGAVRVGRIIDPLDPGHAAVPPGMTDERELAKAKKLLERPNPIQYKETQFAKDWVSDGTLGDVAMQELNRGMKKATEKIFGKEPQQVKARPPPDVRFNPALAENKADLGSEATGDAYKAAPIAHEKPPTPNGEGSRRIREELAAIQKLASQCDQTRQQALLAPVRTHLADLQRTEHALDNGADPVMAAQMLPRQADSAYNLARRALWYARKQWTMCNG
jgi:hypothetical protein